MIIVRRAGALDARPMAELLNAIIRAGGTTSYSEEITTGTVLNWLEKAVAQSAFHLAEDDTGTLLGVQWIAPHPKLPPEACDIATFVRIGQTGLGIGSRLFRETEAAARALGYAWINATIRADNAGGLAYYQSRGFEDYARQDAEDPTNDIIISRISKRYDLR